jgi:oligonucleotide/oligosaccharide-binding OB-fold protein
MFALHSSYSVVSCTLLSPVGCRALMLTPPHLYTSAIHDCPLHKLAHYLSLHLHMCPSPGRLSSCPSLFTVHRALGSTGVCFIHPSSFLATRSPEYVVYGDLVESEKGTVFMRGVTEISSDWMARLGGPLVHRSEPLDAPAPRYTPPLSQQYCTALLWSGPRRRAAFCEAPHEFVFARMWPDFRNWACPACASPPPLAGKTASDCPSAYKHMRSRHSGYHSSSSHHRYNAAMDTVTVFVRPTYGPEGWPLPLLEVQSG